MRDGASASALLLTIAMVTAGASAQAHSMDDARFTGPLLTASPEALPPGMFFVQPYVIYTRTDGRYDDAGDRHAVDARSRDSALTIVMTYGIRERLNGELQFNGGRASVGQQHADGVRMGDGVARLKYVLRPGDAISSKMTISAMLNQSLATGKHDRLNDNVLNGRGSGSHGTGLSLLGQQVLWMPNDRPLRWRWQANWTPSPSRVSVHDSSVYGTDAGFAGQARLGAGRSALLGMEYSINRNWVSALDLTASSKGRTIVSGSGLSEDGQRIGVRQTGLRSRSFSIAPAMEYIINNNVGVLAGLQASLPGGRNSASYVSPMLSMTATF
ncbi:MAG: hypothetical protein ACREP4_10835 [Stenotrophomonas sp.]|uniref:hypothetical protein n=1 Tax=Stenotrophomonas sp. TaxID=69392 RepID=UPI003D6D9988